MNEGVTILGVISFLIGLAVFFFTIINNSALVSASAGLGTACLLFGFFCLIAHIAGRI